MILWHLGLTAAITYVTLGRSRIDYRFVLLGAILPDLVDGVLMLFFAWPAGRGISHSILAPTFVCVAIVGAFKAERRLAVFGIGVGWFVHLALDGMWQAPRTFLWPFFGTGFASTPREPYSLDLFADPLAHVLTWAGELVGIAALTWFWIAFEFGRDDRFRRFLDDGHLRA